MNTIIKISNLSKQYRLGIIGTGTLTNDIKRWWHLARGKEDPYLKISETNKCATKSNSQYIWALKDINLEIMPGEVLGIIGKNGAGKSTLLKILSKVTGPTTGRIDYKGRIGSLLEVGTGFHPELTGRENIYLNGAILGMRKKEIARKFDEIVDFSGVERYIDTPTKRYSSGMNVRLGFAVAAFLEPEILVVDEVLAVGDLDFQKKAIGKMQDVSKNEGRTVLFVSHNMGAIKELCTKAVLIENGQIVFIGKTQETIEKYVNTSDKYEGVWKNDENEIFPITINSIHIKNDKNVICTLFSANDSIHFELTYQVIQNIKNAEISINIHAADGTHILSIHDTDEDVKLLNKRIKGEYKISFILSPKRLNYGKYTVRVASAVLRKKIFQHIHKLGFEILNLDKNPSQVNNRKGYLYPSYKLITKCISKNE